MKVYMYRKTEKQSNNKTVPG